MRRLSVALIVGFVATACTGETVPEGDEVLSGTGPGISISEAIESDLSDPLLVNGYLFVDADGEMTFAEMMAESLPPRPAGATLEVEGLDLSGIEDLESAQGVRWTQDQIQLLGIVADGKLTVSGVSSA